MAIHALIIIFCVLLSFILERPGAAILSRILFVPFVILLLVVFSRGPLLPSREADGGRPVPSSREAGVVILSLHSREARDGQPRSYVSL